jgi:hypothetical protein
VLAGHFFSAYWAARSWPGMRAGLRSGGEMQRRSRTRTPTRMTKRLHSERDGQASRGQKAVREVRGGNDGEQENALSRRTPFLLEGWIQSRIVIRECSALHRSSAPKVQHGEHTRRHSQNSRVQRQEVLQDEQQHRILSFSEFQWPRPAEPNESRSITARATPRLPISPLQTANRSYS